MTMKMTADEKLGAKATTDRNAWRYTQPPEGQRILVMLKPSGFCLYAKRKGAMIYPILYKKRAYGLEAVRAWRIPDDPL